jgi:hypothetical protein
MRSKRELWVKPSLNSMKEEGEGILAKGQLCKWCLHRQDCSPTIDDFVHFNY